MSLVQHIISIANTHTHKTADSHAQLKGCSMATVLISLYICTQPTQTCLRMEGNRQAFIWHSFISWQCSCKQPGMLLLFMTHKSLHDCKMHYIFFCAPFQPECLKSAEKHSSHPKTDNKACRTLALHGDVCTYKWVFFNRGGCPFRANNVSDEHWYQTS